MTLERFIAALRPGDVVNEAPVEVRDLAYDTRGVTPGTLFFCVRGARADGHDFASTAAAAGAGALVVERRLEIGLPPPPVPDLRAAMPPAATLSFRDPTRALPVAPGTRAN